MERVNEPSPIHAMMNTSTRPLLPFSVPLANVIIFPLREGRLTTLFIYFRQFSEHSSPDMSLVVEARRNKASVLRAVGEGVHTLKARGGAAMRQVSLVLRLIQPTARGMNLLFFLRMRLVKYLKIEGTKKRFCGGMSVVAFPGATSCLSCCHTAVCALTPQKKGDRSQRLGSHRDTIPASRKPIWS